MLVQAKLFLIPKCPTFAERASGAPRLGVRAFVCAGPAVVTVDMSTFEHTPSDYLLVDCLKTIKEHDAPEGFDQTDRSEVLVRDAVGDAAWSGRILLAYIPEIDLHFKSALRSVK